jgi:hypothetical protein
MSFIISGGTTTERSSIQPNLSGSNNNIEGRQPRELKFTYSTAGYDSYIKEGFRPPEVHKRADKYEYRFLNAIDIDQGKIKVEVTSMVRLKAIDYSTEKREKKEYLVFSSEWTAKNWMGKELGCSHIEGKYWQQTKVLQYGSPDTETGRVEAYYVKGAPRLIHHIPFTKKEVDRILTSEHPFGADSINITDPSKVVFYGRFDNLLGVMSFRCADFTYEQFVEPSWQKFVELAIRPGGPANRKPKEEPAPYS